MERNTQAIASIVGQLVGQPAEQISLTLGLHQASCDPSAHTFFMDRPLEAYRAHSAVENELVLLARCSGTMQLQISDVEQQRKVQMAPDFVTFADALVRFMSVSDELQRVSEEDLRQLIDLTRTMHKTSSLYHVAVSIMNKLRETQGEGVIRRIDSYFAEFQTTVQSQLTEEFISMSATKIPLASDLLHLLNVLCSCYKGTLSCPPRRLDPNHVLQLIPYIQNLNRVIGILENQKAELLSILPVKPIDDHQTAVTAFFAELHRLGQTLRNSTKREFQSTLKQFQSQASQFLQACQQIRLDCLQTRRELDARAALHESVTQTLLKYESVLGQCKGWISLLTEIRLLPEAAAMAVLEHRRRVLWEASAYQSGLRRAPLPRSELQRRAEFAPKRLLDTLSYFGLNLNDALSTDVLVFRPAEQWDAYVNACRAILAQHPSISAAAEAARMIDAATAAANPAVAATEAEIQAMRADPRATQIPTLVDVATETDAWPPLPEPAACGQCEQLRNETHRYGAANAAVLAALGEPPTPVNGARRRLLQVLNQTIQHFAPPLLMRNEVATLLDGSAGGTDAETAFQTALETKRVCALSDIKPGDFAIFEPCFNIAPNHYKAVTVDDFWVYIIPTQAIQIVMQAAFVAKIESIVLDQYPPRALANKRKRAVTVTFD